MTDNVEKKEEQKQVEKVPAKKPGKKGGKKGAAAEGEEEQVASKVQYLGPDLAGETNFFGVCHKE